MIRLFLADDRPVVLEGLKRILAEYPDIEVVGDATTQEQLLAKLQTAEADILLVDMAVAAPGIFGLLRQLRNDRARVRVLVLSVDGEAQHAVEVLGTGAAGYLTRDHSPTELLAAIRKVARGAEYVSPTLVQRIVASRAAVNDRPRYEALSDREYQVLCMFGSGRAFSSIAAELGVSRKTVSTYRGRILKKLQLASNASLIRYAMQNRLAL
jgi:two-component system, NarL family, invasion response regulator UvrY